MWCYPYLTSFAIIGMGAIIVAMAFIPDQRKPLWFGVVSLPVLIAVYWQRGRWRKDAASTQHAIETERMHVFGRRY